jgi:hypothetical protein
MMTHMTLFDQTFIEISISGISAKLRHWRHMPSCASPFCFPPPSLQEKIPTKLGLFGFILKALVLPV